MSTTEPDHETIGPTHMSTPHYTHTLNDDQRFLTEITKHLDVGIAAYRRDRAANGDKSDAYFVHMFGNTLRAGVGAGKVSADELCLTVAAAMYRLAQWEPQPVTVHEDAGAPSLVLCPHCPDWAMEIISSTEAAAMFKCSRCGRTSVYGACGRCGFFLGHASNCMPPHLGINITTTASDDEVQP